MPLMIRFILEFIATELRSSNVVDCRDAEKDLGEVFRLDAKAEGDSVAIGGWRCADVSRTKEAV